MTDEPTRMTEQPVDGRVDHAPGLDLDEVLILPVLDDVDERDDDEPADAGVEHRVSADDLDELFGADR